MLDIKNVDWPFMGKCVQSTYSIKFIGKYVTRMATLWSLVFVLVATLARAQSDQSVPAEWRFVQPLSLTEALRRLIDVPRLERSNDYKKIEYNRLLLTVDQFMLHKGAALTPGERALYFEFSESLAKKRTPSDPAQPYPAIFLKNDFSKYFTTETGSDDFAHLQEDHYDLLKRSAFARTPEYESWLKKTFQFRTAETEPLAPLEIDKWLALTPMDRALTIFESELIDYLKRIAEKPNVGAAARYSDYFESRRPIEFRLRMANFVHEKVYPSLTEKGIQRLFVGSPTYDFSTIFPQYNQNGTYDSFGSASVDRKLLMLSPEKRELQEMNASLAARIWSNRGYWGTCDALLVNHNFDWPWLWQTLKIDPKAGLGQLQAAIRAFTKTPRYASLIQGVREAEATPGEEIDKSQRNGKLTPKLILPQWMDESMLPYLAGEYNDVLRSNSELQKTARNYVAGALLLSRKAHCVSQRMKDSLAEKR